MAISSYSILPRHSIGNPARLGIPRRLIGPRSDLAECAFFEGVCLLVGGFRSLERKIIGIRVSTGKMPRSSRHRSHRLHKHSRDLSDSEEDGSPRERRIREEEPTASSGARVSRDPEPEKRRSSHEHAGKELVVTSNGDASGEHGKKRKEKAEEVAVADRWNGGEECDHKRSKCEEFGPVELDKSSRSKLLTADSKVRSSRRHDGSNETDENSGGKNDSAKHKSERGADRRESSSQYKDGRARNRIEKDTIKDREVQDSRHDKYDDKHSRKNGPKSGGSTEELTSKKYTTNNGKVTITC